MAEERGFFGRMWDGVKAVLENTIYSDAAMQKAAQGAAELGQALNSQANAYVPYGHGQDPLDVEGPMQSFQEQLREAQQRAVPEQSQEMER